MAQVRIGSEVGIDPEAGNRPDHALTAEGDRCLPDARVDVGAWGADTPVAETIGARTAAVFGEFDRVDRPAAESAVKYLLHLGFGVEARTLITVLPLDGPEVPVWRDRKSVV